MEGLRGFGGGGWAGLGWEGCWEEVEAAFVSEGAGGLGGFRGVV